MSEYQYYEFHAVDRPLDRAVQQALRSISSRARITATTFTNHYEWGDFKGDPRKFMERWFDFHVYLANWGTRRLMMRIPKRLMDRKTIDPILRKLDWVKLWAAGDNLIVDIHRDEVAVEDDWDDGSGWLATLAPLRAEVLSGDIRIFYLVWLTAVQDELISDNEVEPLPGIGPVTGALEGFAAFFGIDPDLVAAAAEHGEGRTATAQDELRSTLANLPECEKVALLLRVADGDPHVGAELRTRFRKNRQVQTARRTVGALKRRAREIQEARNRADAKRRETQRRREAAQAEKVRLARLKAIKQRGEDVWREIEQEIERRNASGYDKAASLLSDLQGLAVEEANQDDFGRRLASIRARHETKRKLIERLSRLGCDSDKRTS